MIQIIYTSIASEDLPSGEIFKIVEKSASNNHENGLSGFLIFHQGQFLQILEGEEAAVEKLMDTLAHDSRHHSIHVVNQRHIPERSFPDWKMKRIFAGNNTTNPLLVSPEFRSAPQNVCDAVTDFLSGPESLEAAE